MNDTEPRDLAEDGSGAVRSSRLKAILSAFGVIAGVALASFLVSFFRTSADNVAIKQDAAIALRQLDHASKDRNAKIELGPEGGPFSRMIAVLSNALLAEQREFEKRAEAAGYTQILTLQGISPRSPTLSRCDRFDSLAVDTQAIGSRYPQQIASARAIGEAAGVSEHDLDEFVAGATGSDYVHKWRLTGEAVTVVGEMCRFLATREWQSRDGEILFADDEDVGRFNQMGKRVDAITAELERRTSAAKAKLTNMLGS